MAARHASLMAAARCCVALLAVTVVSACTASVEPIEGDGIRVRLINRVPVASVPERSEIAGAALRSDGSMFVATAGRGEIHHFERNGTLSATLDVRAATDGALFGITSVWQLSEDSLFLFDAGSGSGVLVDMSTHAVVGEQLRGARSDLDGRGFRLADGHMYVHRGWTLSAMPRPMQNGRSRAVEVVLRYAPEATRPDTVLELPGIDLDVSVSETGFSFRPVPYARALRTAAWDDTLFFGDGGEAFVESLNVHDGSRRRIPLPGLASSCRDLLPEREAAAPLALYSDIVADGTAIWVACPVGVFQPPERWVRYLPAGIHAGVLSAPGSSLRILAAASGRLVVLLAEGSDDAAVVAITAT